jgi:2'-5' RNA ligase
MIRLFVGIALPPPLRLRVSALCGGIPGAKWVDPGNFHVTIRFIGEVSEDVLADIDEALATIKAPPFAISLARVGQFGGGEKTRALWVGVEKNPRLLHLHEKVEHALMRIGLPPDTRKYTPHVTLARLRYVHPGEVQAFIERNALFRAPEFPVDGFSLIASYLTKSGPIYEDQADYPLRG